MYLTRKKLIGTEPEYDEMSEESGKLWSDITRRFWQWVRKKDHWLSKGAIQRWLCSSKRLGGLHSHSAQAVADQFFDALQSWRKNKNGRPPYKQKKYNKVVFKSSAIRLKGGKLYLSRGRDKEPLVFDWKHGIPKHAEIGWNDKQEEYELRVQYEVEPEDRTTGSLKAGIDLGEIHLATAYDGNETLLFNGRELRSKRRYQNKIKARLDSKINRKERGSNRWWKLVQTKNNQLAKIHNQVRDMLHKISRKLVEMLLERGVSTLAIGDVRHIRDDIDYGNTANQRLHQWVHGSFRRMVTYKAKLSGMDVELVDESFTSRTCPSCEHEKNSSPNSRNFSCPECGFEYHRDGVGAMNIRKKYLDSGPVVGAMASPTGVRFDPNMSCSPLSSSKTLVASA